MSLKFAEHSKMWNKTVVIAEVSMMSQAITCLRRIVCDKCWVALSDGAFDREGSHCLWGLPSCLNQRVIPAVWERWVHIHTVLSNSNDSTAPINIVGGVVRKGKCAHATFHINHDGCLIVCLSVPNEQELNTASPFCVFRHHICASIYKGIHLDNICQ